MVFLVFFCLWQFWTDLITEIDLLDTTLNVNSQQTHCIILELEGLLIRIMSCMLFIVCRRLIIDLIIYQQLTII